MVRFSAKLILPFLFLTGLSVLPIYADGFGVCDYNGKQIRCRRDWSNGLMRIAWEDGIADSFRLVQKTTTTTAAWRDSRGGEWQSLSYGGSTILVNRANKNTIIVEGTRQQCISEWRLGGICAGIEE
jgi:hypothetical protein